MKGCPLKCVWCHNPDSIDIQPQVAYYQHKCNGCGECVLVCPAKAHTFCEGGHMYDRGKCFSCGKCQSVCLGDALKFYGREMSAEELMPILLEDREFYENSGGGITLLGENV